MNYKSDYKSEIEMATIKLKEHVAYSEGSIVSKTIYEKDSGTLTLFAFDKGQKLSEHTAPFDAFVQLLDGKVELVIGGKSVIVSEGEMHLMPADVPHAVNGIEKFKMLLIMMKKK